MRVGYYCLYVIGGRGWITNLCVRVPFYTGQYLCYSFFSGASVGFGRPCVSTTVQRVRLHRRCVKKRPLSAVCFKNNAPSRLRRTSFRQVFRTTSHLFNADSYARVALRTGPSSVAPRCITSLHGLPFGQVDVKMRDFGRGSLHFLGQHRSHRRTLHTIKLYGRGNVRGVDVSLVCKLPKRALRR